MGILSIGKQQKRGESPLSALACLPRRRETSLPLYRTKGAMSCSASSSARGILTLPSHTSLHSRKLQKGWCWQPQAVQSLPSLPVQEPSCMVQSAQIPCRSLPPRRNSLFPFLLLMGHFSSPKVRGRFTRYFEPLPFIQVWVLLQNMNIAKRAESYLSRGSGSSPLPPGQRPWNMYNDSSRMTHSPLPSSSPPIQSRRREAQKRN